MWHKVPEHLRDGQLLWSLTLEWCWFRLRITKGLNGDERRVSEAP